MVIIPPPRDPAMVIDAPAGNRLAARDPDQPFRILFTGRLSKVKGVDTLLQAVATLDFPLAVDIVGDGIVREELEQLAHDLGIRSLVRFHGWVSQADIADFYRRADVFVHPARWPEPAGRTIIEAMALGVPAIVSDIGGPPWIAGDAALTFAPGDCADLRDRILTVHQTPEVSSQMRVAARKRIDRYDRRRIAISLANLYDELVPVGTTADGSDSTDATPVVASADAELTSTLISRR
jgi:glycosyltransferase involved in cell wall biosynthesis